MSDTVCSRKFKVHKINLNRRIEMTATIKTKPITTSRFKEIVKEEIERMSSERLPHEDVCVEYNGSDL